MAGTSAPSASVDASANGSHAAAEAPVGAPTNPMATALLTDQYQFSMAYAYWKAGKHADQAVFDLYFRKNPFGGEFTVFAGLEECVKFIANFRFTEDDISFLQSVMPMCEGAFFDYLKKIDCSDVEVYAIPEGSVVFPKVPLIRVQGPVAVVQLLETPFVNLINYASLVTTNAARHRHVAGKSKVLLEFGLRRAQGPDGAISASKYCFMGGFDATSNVLAGNLFGIPLRGTHSHAFVSSYGQISLLFLSTESLDDIPDKSLKSKDGSRCFHLVPSSYFKFLVGFQAADSLCGVFGETNQSELAAFASYALAFPSNFLALVDTYDVMRSGIPNFCAVALALHDLGYKASGIRLDSGDLAYLSIEARKVFCAIEKDFNVPGFGKMIITASNDLNEETIDALNKQGHEVDAFGIGTYLVTCYSQAALGCVFKLVEINSKPRIKLSEDVAKVSIPCKKRCFRLYGKEGYPLVDIMIRESEPTPKVCYFCSHMSNLKCLKFIMLNLSRQENEYSVVIHLLNPKGHMLFPSMLRSFYSAIGLGNQVRIFYKPRAELPSLEKIRSRCMQQLEKLRPDHIRRLNPTPYKQVSVSAKLYDFIHYLWLNEAPVGELQ
ncbi:hypothetical protein PR202_ga20341 [Eleusine coracana subsp. coracana]|uniref:nicotinate phosphoribosyltransferase n=1 Tax=Eleusine coracana subsp. coracana TaxID=191504 RepID=A0AAV5CXH0_ELECO|nr:hypothetical protein PR202_ga20341 [Eleusine coracana subsp. coracana]